MKRATVLLLSLTLAAGAVAQGPVAPGAIEPAVPRRGQRLELRYDPTAATATLPAAAEVFAVTVFVTESGVRNLHVRLVGGETGVKSGAVTVPVDAVHLHAGFVTRQAHDARADLSRAVCDGEGRPVRGASTRAIFEAGADPAEAVAAELRRFPDSLGAYRDKWMITKFQADAETLRRTVEADLAAIGAAATAEGLWARSYGLMLLGREAEARALVLQAAAEHPAAWATGRAVKDYEYAAYEQQIQGPGPAAVARRKRELVEACPGTRLARDEVRGLAADAGFPLAATVAVCRAWIDEEPLHPEPHLAWAAACLAHGADLATGAEHARAAINHYLNGDVRLAGDPRALMVEHLLPYAFRVAAQLALARDDHGTALGYARAAQAVEPRTRPHANELEARIWGALGDRRRAERAWADALSRGSTVARGELLVLWRAAHADDGGFEDHLSKLLDESGGGSRPEAPAFGGEDLAGGTFALEALRGRVVVLNFWGLGCAPCKVEIPDLSRMADRYRAAERPVEFLAFATDPAPALRDYLAGHPFTYRVVAESGAVAARYRVQSWPTHVLIDKRGRIAATLVGGGAGQDERLSALIDRLLAE